MKKLSKKSALLFAAVMALAAFAMPSMASALNWGPSGTYSIDSANLSMTVAALGSGSICDSTNISADANGGASLTVTSITFSSCRGTGQATGCPVDATAAGLHYNADGASLSTVAITGVNVNVRYTTGCPLAGSTVNVAGTLGGGTFDNTAHNLVFSADTGLSATSAGSPLGGVTVSGTLVDTSGALTLS